MKLKKGDLVEVIAGKDKGKQGAILKIDRKKDRVTVEKINIVKKHIKRSEGQVGEIREIEAALHISNVMIVDPKSGKPTRIGYKFLEDGKKVRVAKSSGEELG
ncbi:MAG: 50S ribosomal protein L24 [Candidatus Cloacimonadota bacterium]|nr:MAG: 50S ribosomal protein L24 [Candidatus Cloacimonadota bacterium]